MEVDQNPNAQGTDQQVAGESNAAEGAGSQAAGSGIQKRIDELVGKGKAEAERFAQESAAKDAQIAELVRAVAAQSQQRQTAPDPADDLDPEERRKFERLLAPMQAEFKQTLARIEAQASQQRVRAVAAQVGDPRIEARAEQLMGIWQRAGHTGWVPEDAVRYAAGEIALAERSDATKARDERGRFNAAGSGNLNGGASNPNLGGNTQQPKDLDSLPLDQQIAEYEKRLKGKGF